MIFFMHKNRWLFLFILLFLCNIYSQESPFDKNSRLLLAGFTVPEHRVYFENLPIWDNESFPLNFEEKDKHWILLFLSSIDPLLEEQKNNFNLFSEKLADNRIQTRLIVNSETITSQWSTRLLGLEIWPSVVIINKDGQIIGVQEGAIPDWQNENLQLFIKELE